MKNLKTDLMGIIDFSQFANGFEPYETEDGWTVVLPGEEDGRRKAHGQKLVAESKIEIKLDNTANVLKCISALEESDRRLREVNGPKPPPYDWQKVLIRENNVRFGVSWYDLDFFNSRKDVWSASDHNSMYERFGATAENFSVEHIKK